MTRRPKRTKIFAALVLLAGTTFLSAQQRRSPGLFSPLDLGLLEPPDREAWQKPEQVMDALYVGEASVVADLGAGGGWFTIRLARRVGQNGTVYAEDIQRLMIEAIQRRVTREGLGNVKTVLGTGVDPFPGLLLGTLDAVLIVDAFHEMAEPVVLLRNVARALKPQGRIGIIDYREGEGGPGPGPDERVPPSVIAAKAKEAGLTLDREETFLRYQYFLIFRK
jgi:ubiquinone/menaquinone biosynthesis C-methylase UbiE